jgi:kynurenine formamidase
VLKNRLLLLAALASAGAAPSAPELQKWKKGQGWGWVWGPGDQVGALNEMTDASRRAALAGVAKGRVYDLGLTYDRTSFRAPVHSPGEIITFRSPAGVRRQGDLPGVLRGNASNSLWHSCALFVNDNVATQIDGLAHVTDGADNHWYNGFKEADCTGNWGPLTCDASTIPPIIARGVLIDVARFKGVDVLPGHTPITARDLQGALDRQGTALRPGDVVLVRTGTARLWGASGADHATIGAHDTSGLTLDAAKWLVEENGALLVGSDTSSLEYFPGEKDEAEYRERHGTFIPVHRYLIVEQGVHVGEFHNLEELARDRVYEFCYVCCTNKIRGSTSGFALRPLALR